MTTLRPRAARRVRSRRSAPQTRQVPGCAGARNSISVQNSAPVPGHGVSPRQPAATTASPSSTSMRQPSSAQPADDFAPTLTAKRSPAATAGGMSQTARLVSCSASVGRHGASGRILGRVAAGDAAEHDAARQAVLGEAALRFARAIEARDDLAADVDHLRVGVGAQARSACRAGSASTTPRRTAASRSCASASAS